QTRGGGHWAGGAPPARVPGGPAATDSEVTPASLMPQGTILSNQPRSQSQLSANPCMVTPRDTRMPTAPTFRSGPPSPVIHTPLRPSTLVVTTPASPQHLISASSRARTQPITSSGSARPVRASPTPGPG